MPADPKRVRDLFLAAAERPSADRPAFLADACGPDGDLRAAVERLLAAHDDPASVLASGGATADRSPSVAPAADEWVGQMVAGKYKLLEAIGEGGMGSVYMAQQTAPVRRTVAVKLIKPGMDTKTVLARFEAERQALALMDHPNIAKVLDAGTTERGSPYFVMELVKGVPITKFCDERKLSPRERLELFVPVCQAVQHAHQKGVIHRDIKPSNVLVALYDERPVPKVIDFGVAKATGQQLTERTLHTGFGGVVGTPEYMSPEQATFNQLDIDTRSDIYSLGVLLYELMAGSTPFHRRELETAGLLEMLRIVREEEPVRPSTKVSTAAAMPSIAQNRRTEPKKLTALLRGEVDWIVMKALEKDRGRRYDTATGMAADVQRYLAGEPVLAVPPGAGYRLRKFVRKHRRSVAAAAVVLFAVLLGVVGISLGLVAANQAREVARHEERRAQEEEKKALAALGGKEEALAAESKATQALQASLATERQMAYDLTIPLVQKALQENDTTRAAALLASCPPDLRRWEWNYLNRQFDRGAMTLRPPLNDHPPTAFTPETASRFTADGREVITITAPIGSNGRSLTVQAWNAQTGAPAWSWSVDGQDLLRFALSPDARLLATWKVLTPPAARERSGESDPSVVTLREAKTGKVVTRLTGHTSRITQVIFGPDNKRIATGSYDRTVRVWDDAGQSLNVLTGHEASMAVPLAFTPDGKGVVSAGLEPLTGPSRRGAGGPPPNPKPDELRVWDLGAGQTRLEGVLPQSARGQLNSSHLMFEVSPDGRHAVILEKDTRQLIDLTTGRRALPLPEDTEVIGFLGDGQQVLTMAGNGVISVVDLGSARVLRTFRPATLATGAPDTLFADAAGTRLFRRAWPYSLSADGKRLAVSHMDGARIEVLDTATGREVGVIPKPTTTGSIREDRAGYFMLSTDGNRMLTTNATGELRVWDLTARSQTTGWSAPSEAAAFWPVAVSPDGRLMAVRVFGTSPDGRYERIELVNLTTGQKVTEVASHKVGEFFLQVSFSPDSRRLGARLVESNSYASQVSGREAGLNPNARECTHVLWDVTTGQELFRGRTIWAETTVGASGVPKAWFSADGVFLVAHAAGRDDGSVKSGQWQIEEVESGRTRFVLPEKTPLTLELSPGGHFAAAFIPRPNGLRAQSSPGQPPLEVWDLDQKQRLWALPADPNKPEELLGVFSRDGERLLTYEGRDIGTSPTPPRSRKMWVWETRTGRLVCSFTAPAGSFDQNVLFTPDGQRIVSHSTVWNAATGRILVSLTPDAVSVGRAGPFIFTDAGRLLIGNRRLDAKAADTRSLLVLDGSPTDTVWKPSPTVEDMLDEAYRLTESAEPRQQNPAAAVELTSRAVEAYPSEAGCWAAHGLALLRAGRDREAVAALERCVQNTRGPASARRYAEEFFLLAMARQRVGDLARAKSSFDDGEARARQRLQILPLLPSARAPQDAARAERFRAEAAAALGIKLEPLPPPAPRGGGRRGLGQRGEPGG